MNRPPEHPKLTPLRAMSLLADTPKKLADLQQYEWDKVREALTEHVKAHLVRARKR